MMASTSAKKDDLNPGCFRKAKGSSERKLCMQWIIAIREFVFIIKEKR